VAAIGYRGFQQNRRVVVPGGRNAFLAGLVRFVPRRAVLSVVRGLQSPA
jgi:hypothetical protein